MVKFVRRLLVLGLMLPSLVGTARASESSKVGSFRMLEFHSNLWINLQHFLYQQALPRSSNEASALLSGAEKAAWTQAVEYYRQHIISKDLLFDRSLVKVDSALATEEEDHVLTSEDIPKDVRGELNTCAPIYRHKFWATHDQENRF